MPRYKITKESFGERVAINTSDPWIASIARQLGYHVRLYASRPMVYEPAERQRSIALELRYAPR